MNDHFALYKSSRLQYCICTSPPQITVEIDMKKMQLLHRQKWSHSSELLSVTLPMFIHEVFLLNSSRRGILLPISLEYKWTFLTVWPCSCCIQWRNSQCWEWGQGQRFFCSSYGSVISHRVYLQCTYIMTSNWVSCCPACPGKTPVEGHWSFVRAAVLGDPLAARLILSKTAGGFGCFIC